MSDKVITIDIRGAAAAARIIGEFDRKIRRRIVTSAVRAGAGEMKKSARSRSPVVSGTMRRQLTIRGVKLDRSTGTVVATIGIKRTKSQQRKGVGHAGRYLHLVVGGTRPHEIRPATKQSLAISGNPVERVSHPGSRADPFLDRALRSSMTLAIKAFRDRTRERIETEAAKLRASQPTNNPTGSKK